MFQLSKEECLSFQSGTLEAGTIANMDTLRFQNGTSKSVRGGNRYATYAFTENGIAMLSSVLRSERAIAVNVRIMREFTTMRRALVSMVPMQSRLEAIERRQISDQSRNEERFDQIFAKMSEGDLPLAQIFYQGKFWDAKSFLIKFIRRRETGRGDDSRSAHLNSQGDFRDEQLQEIRVANQTISLLIKTEIGYGGLRIKQSHF